MSASRKFAANELGLITVTVGCYLAVVALALAPNISVTQLFGIPDKLAHVLAFVCLGILTTVLSPKPVRIFRICAALTVFAAVLELSQFFSANRTVCFADFLASAAGVPLGVVFGFVARRWRAQFIAASRSSMARFGLLAPTAS